MIRMVEQFHIDGETAIVTGASQGIGEAIAKRFAADGVNVGICARSKDTLNATAEAIRNSDRPGNVYAATCDVRDSERVHDFVDEVVNEFGPIDVLVNNAGGSFQAHFEDLSENAWKTIIDINLHGVFHFTQAVGSNMRQHNGGYIVNMISGAGLEGGSPRMSQYGAAKAGVKNLTESLSDEWKEYNIRINAISPGLIATEGVVESLGINPDEMPERALVDRPIGYPEETADIAQFLCSTAASYLNGSTIKAGVPSSESFDRKDPDEK